MMREIAELIVKEDPDEFRLYENYSGKGMFGETTYGIVYSYLIYLIERMFVAATKNGDMMSQIELRGMDNMGLDKIIY